MRILITGATGLVGKQLSKELLLKGHELIVIGRSTEERFREQFTLPCEYYNWTNFVAHNIDAVFHLAGDSIASSRWSEKKKNSIRDSRVKTTKILTEAFKGKWPKVFIGASAIGYYGSRGSEVLTEESSKGTGFLPEVCDAWEKSSTDFESNSRTVRLRIGIVLASEGGFLSPQEKLFSFGLGGKIADGKQWMSWIHIEDLVNLMLFSLENPITGTFNATAPTPVTNSEWTEAYAKQLNVASLFTAPQFALKILLGEMSQLALDSQKVSCEKIMEKGFSFKFNTIAVALKDIYRWKSSSEEMIFQSEQWIAADREKIFPFFSDAQNLEKITPPWLNFKVLKQSKHPISTGTLIDYKISLKGIPMKWKTKIENWNPPHSFVDDQLKGPYKKWHHTHSFEQFPNGTLMKDQVIYKLPLGLLGRLIAGSYVRADVTNIFKYRTKIINKIPDLKSGENCS